MHLYFIHFPYFKNFFLLLVRTAAVNPHRTLVLTLNLYGINRICQLHIRLSALHAYLTRFEYVRVYSSFHHIFFYIAHFISLFTVYQIGTLKVFRGKPQKNLLTKKKALARRKNLANYFPVISKVRNKKRSSAWLSVGAGNAPKKFRQGVKKIPSSPLVPMLMCHVWICHPM